MSNPGAPVDSGIEVQLGFFPLAFLLLFCAPKVDIDGVEHKKSWGTHFIPTPPGRHTVGIYFRYLTKAKCGFNSITVNVAPGKRTRLKYYMPPWMFAAGSLKEV